MVFITTFPTFPQLPGSMIAHFLDLTLTSFRFSEPRDQVDPDPPPIFPHARIIYSKVPYLYWKAITLFIFPIRLPLVPILVTTLLSILLSLLLSSTDLPSLHLCIYH